MIEENNNQNDGLKGISYKILKQLRQEISEESENVRKQWNRTLPIGDYLIDRWQKAKDLGFGDGTSIYDSSVILGDVRIGKNTWVGPFTLLDGSGVLSIGSYCSISAGVHIYTHDTVKWATSGGKLEVDKSPVTIGNRCYFGPHSIITKGITIGDGCIIGANSLVNKDVPPGMKVWGNPAKIIGEVENYE